MPLPFVMLILELARVATRRLVNPYLTQSIIMEFNIPPNCFKMAQNLVLRCVLVPHLWCRVPTVPTKTHLESTIKQFNPPFVCRTYTAPLNCAAIPTDAIATCKKKS